MTQVEKESILVIILDQIVNPEKRIWVIKLKDFNPNTLFQGK